MLHVCNDVAGDRSVVVIGYGVWVVAAARALRCLSHHHGVVKELSLVWLRLIEVVGVVLDGSGLLRVSKRVSTMM